MIGIHEQAGTFSDRWMGYCVNKGIPFRRINCLGTDVVKQCEGLDAVLWHWPHSDLSAQLVARQIIRSLEQNGTRVFPSTATCWHYDDKIAQKYLLDALDAPLIRTWVFTNKSDAMDWIARATWPKVFKLRCGAGSYNVKLLRSQKEAADLCEKAFGKGFLAAARCSTEIQNGVLRTKTVGQFWRKLKRAPQTLSGILSLRKQVRLERGYMYFQDFLPGNSFDTRVTVIGGRAFGFMRVNRPGDFRASGSGSIVYEPDRISRRSIEIAFNVTEQLGAQSLAFDFLFNSDKEPMISEISYCYLSSAVYACAGYWDRLNGWHEGHVWPEEAILEDMLAACHRRT